MRAPRLAAFLFAQAMARIVAVREPDFIVGADAPGGAYLERWYVTPWRRWREQAEATPTRWNRAKAYVARFLPNLYLHHFKRDDDDRALHDHPSFAASLLLGGAYVEHTIAAGGIHHRTAYRAGDLRCMGTLHAHRIELYKVEVGGITYPSGCWTLFLFGPTVREWGFHCPERGWVHWREFTADGKPGEVGKGCDA